MSMKICRTLWFLCMLGVILSTSNPTTLNVAMAEVHADGTSIDLDLCDTTQWISQNGSVPGYHVLCVTHEPNNELNIEFYRDGLDDPLHSGQFTTASQPIQSLRLELEEILQIHKTDSKRDSISNPIDKFNPWSICAPHGAAVAHISDISGLLLVFEGGVFMYPAIRIGFVRDVVIESNTFQLTTLSVHPVVFSVSNFISSETCDHIISISEPFMMNSE
eukprot:84524_1